MEMEMELEIIVRESFSGETVMENREREAEKKQLEGFFWETIYYRKNIYRIFP